MTGADETRGSWDDYFMKIAETVASRATCDRKHVGAVIERGRTILATGYNGSIAGLEHCDEVGHMMEDDHCTATIHAEQNVIQTAAKTGLRLAYPTGWSLFTTHCPCSRCATIIADSGVSLVVYERRSEFEKRWREDLVQSHLIFQEARISVLRRSVGVTTPRKSETDEDRAYHQYVFEEPEPGDGTFQLGESNSTDSVRQELEIARRAYLRGSPLERIQDAHGVAYETSRAPNQKIEHWFVLGDERIKL
jgi:dCMP deaminase